MEKARLGLDSIQTHFQSLLLGVSKNISEAKKQKGNIVIYRRIGTQYIFCIYFPFLPTPIQPTHHTLHNFGIDTPPNSSD